MEINSDKQFLIEFISGFCSNDQASIKYGMKQHFLRWIAASIDGFIRHNASASSVKLLLELAEETCSIDKSLPQNLRTLVLTKTEGYGFDWQIFYAYVDKHKNHE